MFWFKEDGIAGIEMVVVFAIVGILTFTVIPYYTSLTNHAHDAKVKAMYSMINASIIVAAVDSVTVGRNKRIPEPSQLSLKKTATWFDSKNWSDNRSGKWTYLPTGAIIVYNKINQDDFSLEIIYKE